MSCAGKLPIWISHGVDDQTIPFADGEAQRDAWIDRNGCVPPATPSYPLDACTMVEGCPNELPVVWCPTTETDWNGHAVPGLADQEMWAFFSGVP